MDSGHYYKQVAVWILKICIELLKLLSFKDLLLNTFSVNFIDQKVGQVYLIIKNIKSIIWPYLYSLNFFFDLVTVDFNFIDKNYFIENWSFYIMTEGIMGKRQTSDVPTHITL